MPDEYREYRPGPGLRQHVHRYWALRASSTPASAYQRALPLGLPELIVAPEGSVSMAVNGHVTIVPRAAFCAQMTASRRFETSRTLHLFGVCFTPAGHSLLRPPASSELVDRLTSAHDLSARAGALARRLLGARNDAERSRIADATLSSMVGGAEESAQVRRVREAALILVRNRGVVEIGALASNLGVSISFLERAFKRHVGLGPKQYAELVRFGEVLGRLDGARSVQDLMDGQAYFDQAHLTRDFRRRVGVPPAGYLRAEKSAMERAILQHRGFLQAPSMRTAARPRLLGP